MRLRWASFLSHSCRQADVARKPISNMLLLLTLVLASTLGAAQTGGGHILFGDFRVDESKVTGPKPISFDLLLYTSAGRLVARQSVVNNSRFRFLDVPNGDYDIVVEVEGNEVARIHVLLQELVKTDIRQDIALEWHERSIDRTVKDKTTSAADLYPRTTSNQKRFMHARELIDKKKYEDAIVAFQDILKTDPGDYQCWTELGTAYLIQSNAVEAEKAYMQAVQLRPNYVQVLLNLGRLRILRKNFEGAIEPLSTAVALEPTSADVNYYLGEAYLQVKKGSKAVTYLYEAIKLDPVGKAEAHLRLAALYNAVGMKDKAANEYEQFLKVVPDYKDKKRLQEYIIGNKKP